jgi:hypothetical protein
LLSAETEGLQHIGFAFATNAQHVRVRVVCKNGIEELIESAIGVAAQQYSLLARVHNVAGKVHPCVSLARAWVGVEVIRYCIGREIRMTKSLCDEMQNLA